MAQQNLPSEARKEVQKFETIIGLYKRYTPRVKNAPPKGVKKRTQRGQFYYITKGSLLSSPPVGKKPLFYMCNFHKNVQNHLGREGFFRSACQEPLGSCLMLGRSAWCFGFLGMMGLLSFGVMGDTMRNA